MGRDAACQRGESRRPSVDPYSGFSGMAGSERIEVIGLGLLAQ